MAAGTKSRGNNCATAGIVARSPAPPLAVHVTCRSQASRSAEKISLQFPGTRYLVPHCPSAVGLPRTIMWGSPASYTSNQFDVWRISCEWSEICARGRCQLVRHHCHDRHSNVCTSDHRGEVGVVNFYGWYDPRCLSVPV